MNILRLILRRQVKKAGIKVSNGSEFNLKKSRLERFLQFEIDNINNHLPKVTLPLKILLEHPEPSYICRDGTKIKMSTEEIKFISTLIPSIEWNSVKLPIILLRRRDLGNGAYTIAESMQNLYIIKKLLGEEKSWWEFRYTNPSFVVYKPMLKEIRKILPSTSVIGIA